MLARKTPRALSTTTRLFSTSSVGLAHHKFAIVGSGTAGVTVAAQLIRALQGTKDEIKKGELVIIDKKERHDYQPGWTLAGTGLAKLSELQRSNASVTPSPAILIPSYVESFEPTKNSLKTDNETITYDYLVVTPGLKLNIDGIKGLKEALADPKVPVSSIYEYTTIEKTWEHIQAMQKGTAIFTQPAGIIKCAGAPQKVMWMAWSTWKNAGLLESVKPAFITGMPAMFAVPKYAKALNALREERGIEGLFNTNLIAVDGQKKVATFKTADGEIQRNFDFLHVVPPQGPLDFIKDSPLADAAGFVSVSPETTQHTKYPNIFAIGDASSLPTSKTAAAISSEAPVLVDNLVSYVQGKELVAGYDGYTSCPLLTGHNELMLAEFKYAATPKESFSWLFGSQDKPRAFFYWLKTSFFPQIYWSSFLKGTWFGPKGPIKPYFPRASA